MQSAVSINLANWLLTPGNVYQLKQSNASTRYLLCTYKIWFWLTLVQSADIKVLAIWVELHKFYLRCVELISITDTEGVSQYNQSDFSKKSCFDLLLFAH